jgi:hypothetical protein
MAIDFDARMREIVAAREAGKYAYAAELDPLRERGEAILELAAERVERLEDLELPTYEAEEPEAAAEGWLFDSRRGYVEQQRWFKTTASSVRSSRPRRTSSRRTGSPISPGAPVWTTSWRRSSSDGSVRGLRGYPGHAGARGLDRLADPRPPGVLGRGPGRGTAQGRGRQAASGGRAATIRAGRPDVWRCGVGEFLEEE